MLQVNDSVPAFEARDDKGQPFTLASLNGKRVVVFFYPKADTPG